MGWEKRGYAGRIVVACLLLVAFEGCLYRPRHGLIFRGDFALELNRIPWLASRGDVYQEGSAAALDCSEDGTGPVDPLPALGDGANASLGDRFAASGACRYCGNRGDGGPTPKPLAETGRSRFHPVPTRPVFRPPTDRSATMEREPDRSEWDKTLPPLQGNEPAPLPPATEVIPAPAPDPTDGWKPKDGDQEGPQSTDASPTSFPPMELKVGRILRGSA